MTTVTSTVAAALAGPLGLIITVTLIACLIVKEIVSAAPEQRAIRWERALDIGIVPLLVTFAVIAAV